MVVMADVFVYMYFVGLGLAGGIGSVAWIGWIIYKKTNNKDKAKQKKAKANIF